MFMGATAIWDIWNAGGPFSGETRANGRVTVDADWQLVLKESSFHRGRGTWWRDDPSTLTEFALSTSWLLDSRLRRGDRSFQRVRNGEWTYWGGDVGSVTIPPPPSGTRAALALYLKTEADDAYAADNTLQQLPAYDGLQDYPDISGLPSNQITAIGQMNQANILVGFPDGNFKPSVTASDAEVSLAIERLQEFLTGSRIDEDGRAVRELPNVETISWDRSIDTDAAECTITMSNVRMKLNTEVPFDESEFGYPGYYTPTRGDSPDAVSRWPNHVANEWAGWLAPNSIVRTYEGYGGEDMTIQAAMAAGYLRQTGTWMIDRVVVGTDGKISIEARDMARLLIEQYIIPDTVPVGIYPLRYCRYVDLETGERRSGNYFDYMDIVYDLLLWAGFLYDVFPLEQLPDLGGGPPAEPAEAGWAQVHGVMETTGAYADQCLPDDIFDKRPIIDAITEIRGIVGYLFWIDEEGGAHFQSPNWFQPGNFDEDQVHIDFVPEIDERVNATGYSMTSSSENTRTQIVISSEAIPPVPPYGSSAETYAAYQDAISRATFFTPAEGQQMWHGMQLPAMWINGAFSDPEEQQLMAELIAMHIFYRSRQSTVTMAGNPCIQINDQVRIYERMASETYIHYVRGISSSLDNQTGKYEMQLTTHWLGDGNDWPGDAFGGLKVQMRKPA